MSLSLSLCKYRDALGVPGKGVHSLRIGGIAIADVVLTLIGAYIIAYYARASFAWTAAGLFLLGIILHRLFCVRTTIDKLLFPTAKWEKLGYLDQIIKSGALFWCAFEWISLGFVNLKRGTAFVCPAHPSCTRVCPFVWSFAAMAMYTATTTT